MARLLTDREILRAIYDRYVADYRQYDATKPARSTKQYVPIDLAAIAAALHGDVDLVFGRLHYHLDPKYRRPEDGESNAPFFIVKVTWESTCLTERHLVNFPLLDSTLADLDLAYRRTVIPVMVAVSSTIVAV